VHRKTFQ